MNERTASMPTRRERPLPFGLLGHTVGVTTLGARLRVALIAVVVILLAATQFPSHVSCKGQTELQRKRQKQKAIEAKIRRSRQQLAQMLRREKEVLDSLDNLDRKLAEASKRRAQIAHEASILRSQIKGLSSELASLEERLDEMKGQFGRRVVALYKTQKTSVVALLLSGPRLSEILRNYHLWRIILKSDVDLIQRHSEAVRHRREIKEQLLAGHRKLIESLRELNRLEEQVRGQREEKRALLAVIRREKDLKDRALKETERAAKRLQEVIDSLEAASRRSRRGRRVTGFKAQMGRLPLPVRGKITRAFGKQVHPLWRTFTVNNGIEFAAPLGEEVRAVYEGSVVFAGWLKGYGNVLIIDHGGGYFTLCGHLSHLVKRQGEFVEQGEVVGYVGDTGTLEGPSLYFEIREGRRPLNPSPWFGARRGTRAKD